MTTKLPININHDVTSALLYANPLSVLSTDKNMIPWINENYILIDGIESKGDPTLLYLDGFSISNIHYYKNALNFNTIPLYIVNDCCLTDQIIETINNRQYVYIYLDEYYIINSLGGMRKHYYNELLIYGYDLDEKLIYGATIDNTGHYNLITETFDNVTKGFESTNSELTSEEKKSNPYFTWYLKNRFVVIEESIKEMAYPYSKHNFCDKLIRYLSGEMKPDELFFSGTDANNHYMGIRFYDLLLKKINEDTGYHLFLLSNHLFEHKKNLLNKLNYLNSCLTIDISNLVEEYKQHVYIHSKLFRMKLLKINMDWTKNRHIDINEVSDIIRSMIIEMKGAEQNIIVKIIDVIN